MKIHLKLALLIAALNMSPLKAQVSTSDYHLGRLKLFGFSEDTLSDAAIENLALNKMDSILFAETDSHFVYFPQIDYRYSFRDIPFLKLFGIWSGSSMGAEYNPYKELLFNTCDSTAYHYGGGPLSFSQVIRVYLRTHFDSTSIFKILSLYLNTTSRKSAYYIVLSPDDFARCYDDWYRDSDTSIQFIREKRDENTNLAKKLIKESEIRRKDDKFYAKLYTYNAGKGRLEYWCFVIYPDKIELKDFKILARDVRIITPID